jgi:hypothetical protein
LLVARVHSASDSRRIIARQRGDANGMDRRCSCPCGDHAIVLQQKVSRRQLERRLANIPRLPDRHGGPLGSHHIGRQLAALGHDVRLIPAQYVKPFLRVTRTTIAMPRRSRKPCSASARDAKPAGPSVRRLGPVYPTQPSGTCSCRGRPRLSRSVQASSEMHRMLLEFCVTPPQPRPQTKRWARPGHPISGRNRPAVRNQHVRYIAAENVTRAALT